VHPRILVVALLLPAALAGCANYLEPFGGAAAKLRFVSLPGNRTEIRELPDSDCVGSAGASIATVGLSVTGGHNQGRSQGMPLQETVQRPTASETVVRAGKPFAAQLQASKSAGPRGANWSYEACTKSFVLTPKEGENYEAQLEQYRGGCVINIFRISRERDGTYVRRVAETGRELKTRCN
jgi:hypothetical protein